MQKINLSDARKDLANIVNGVAYRQERVILARRGKALAALVPADDLERLERMDGQGPETGNGQPEAVSGDRAG